MTVLARRPYRLPPVVSFWRAEDIINWSVERVGDRVVLVELVLRDGEQFRVLKLNGTNGSDGTDACVMEVWGAPSPDGAGATGVAWVLRSA